MNNILNPDLLHHQIISLFDRMLFNHHFAQKSRQKELKTMMQTAGFGHVDYHNLTGGMVALHVGIKC